MGTGRYTCSVPPGSAPAGTTTWSPGDSVTRASKMTSFPSYAMAASGSWVSGALRTVTVGAAPEDGDPPVRREPDPTTVSESAPRSSGISRAHSSTIRSASMRYSRNNRTRRAPLDPSAAVARAFFASRCACRRVRSVGKSRISSATVPATVAMLLRTASSNSWNCSCPIDRSEPSAYVTATTTCLQASPLSV